jgi:hypothetical protein
MIIYNEHVLMQIPRIAATTLQKLGQEKKDGGSTIDVSTSNMFETYTMAIQSGKVDANMPVTCISRNPYDRLFSIYIQRNLRRQPGADELLVRRGQPPSERFLRRFKQFVLDGALAWSIQNRPSYFPMTHYVNGIPDDKLQKIAMEDTSTYQNTIRSFFGLASDADIPVLRKMMGKPSYMEYYTPEMIAIVNDLYRADFEKFGYEMAA